jgi:hypothetical protein
LKGAKGAVPKRGKALAMSASQMLHFAMSSPEIIRPLLPKGATRSPIWLAWMAHLRYFSALMQPSFTDSSIDALDGLIFDAHTQFLNIPEYKAIWLPKFHFAQHFPIDIRRFGPPRGYWCMRHEAKNQAFKKAGLSSDFKQVAKAVAHHWAIASAERLRRRSQRSSHTEILGCLATEPLGSDNSVEHTSAQDWIGPSAASTLTWLQGVHHLGQDLEAGTWAVIDGKLACFTSIFQVDCTSGDPLIGVAADVYTESVVHIGSDGSRYAYESTLAQQSSYETCCYQLSSLTLTVLMSALLRNRRRFFELP